MTDRDKELLLTMIESFTTTEWIGSQRDGYEERVIKGRDLNLLINFIKKM